MTVSEIQQTFYTGIVIQGKKLLDSGMVADPKLIDIAMIWGAGFPSDKGGPMKWADLTGLSLKLNDSNFYKKEVNI
jgi:3-hydroxyacyl-CoA dehydrogenase